MSLKKQFFFCCPLSNARVSSDCNFLKVISKNEYVINAHCHLPT